MFAELNEIVLHVTDTIFLARVGVAELGAIAIADTLLELFLVIPLGLVDGIQILTARQIGRKRPQAAGGIFNQGLVLILAISLGLTTILALGTSLFSELLVRSPRVAAAVDQFLQVGCYGIPFAAATFAYSALLVSLGRTRALIPATLVLASTNCALGYVLIFGKLGLPALGIRGAALASVGAEIAVFVFLTGYLLARTDLKQLSLFRFRGWDRRGARLLARISAPVSLQALVEAVRWFVFFLILERMGAITLAVANVVYACYEVFRVPTEAFGETACSMVSRFVGRDQSDRIGTVVWQASRLALLVTLPVVVLALALPDWILSIFTLDETLLSGGMGSLRIVALGMLVIIPGEMWFAAVVGTGDTPAALAIETIITIVMLVLTYVLAIGLSGKLELVWISLPIAWLTCLALSYVWMRSGMWRRLAI